MKKRLKIKIAILLTLLFTTIFCFYYSIREGRGGILTVAFLNVGQGDAILIDSPSGNQMLIDGGIGRVVLRELGRVMPFYDKTIDVVVATHPDADHIGGLNDILNRYSVGLYMKSGVDNDTSVYRELKSRIDERKAQGKLKTIEARKGMVVDLGDGVIFEILYPIYDMDGIETNTASIVGRLVYGQNSFIFTGDSPQNIEEYLVSISQEETFKNSQGFPLELESDVLKVGHHGSRTSTGEIFVNAVSPQYAVISAGKDNRYGHPHREVLDILGKFNVKTINTADLGRIIFKSDGINLKLKK